MKRKQGIKAGRVWCLLLALALLLTGTPGAGGEGPAGIQTAFAASGLKTGDKVIIRFTDVTGKKYFRDLQTTAMIGDTIILPEKEGYRWSLGGEYSVSGGEKLELLADADWSGYFRDKTLTFQAERFYYVEFFSPNGGSSRAMRALKAAVAEGEELVIPAVPVLSGFTGLGWSTKKKDTEVAYDPGDTLTVQESLKLYAVRKRTVMASVAFADSEGNGSSQAYRSLKTQVEAGGALTLPEVPKAKGYTGVGWTTEKGKTEPLYKPGSSVRITGNTQYYAVQKESRTYTVSFYRLNGRSSSSLKKMKMTVEEGSTITLPSIPVKKGYVGIGWSTRKNKKSKVKKEGTELKVTKNLKLYSVVEKAVTVSLCKNDGTLYRDLTVGKGDYLTLPTVSNAPGYTFMGWSRTMGKTTNPEYEAGGRIRVNGSVKLYAVVFNRSLEPELGQGDFVDVDLWKRKYKQVIFVGDSRIARMDKTLQNQFGTDSTVTWNVRCICKPGMGLDWLKSDGGTQLMEIANKNNSVQRPTAVIFNLGINDLVNLSGYVEYLEALAPELEKRNCALFFMSLNPGNSKMMENTGHAPRDEGEIRRFNKAMRTRLSGDYSYIDTYSWLLDTGYGTNGGTDGRDSTSDDGLHYTTKTYKRIFWYCLNELLTK